MRTNCVILNYQDAKTTKALTQLLLKDPHLYHIILVDNASEDDSTEQLKKLCCEKVILLQAETNKGYGIGNDLGIRYSIETDHAEAILVANPDVTFTPFVTKRMQQVLQKHPEVGAVAPAILDQTYPDMRNSWPLRSFTRELLSMGPITRRLFKASLQYPDNYYRKADGTSKNAIYTDCLHGSLLMYRKEAYLAAGGYDPNIFLYQEEAIMGQKLKATGWRSVQLLNCAYHHNHSQSISSNIQSALKRQKLREESTLYYFRNYLHINSLQEKAAKLWFSILNLEIITFETLFRK